MIDPDSIGVIIRTRGIHMSRSKYQRPSVKLWKGKSGVKYWRAEWRVYIEGRLKPKHRVETWLQSEHSKTEAQKLCDAMVREETGGAARPDGSLTVKEFWDQVYWPTAKLRIAPNTQLAYGFEWKKYISGPLGKTELQHVNKAAVDAILNRMALDGKSEASMEHALSVIHSLFSEAVESGYVIKNPAHRVTLPRGKAKQETRALTEDEARRVMELPTSRAALYYRVMLLTGARPSEVLALTKADIRPSGLVIDESSFQGKACPTKNRKERCAPLPAALRAELEDWAAKQPGHLLFPKPTGDMDALDSQSMRAVQREIRAATKIPDLTPRMCRTTFATLFRGDPRDIQGILGHSTVDLTMNVYRHVITERQQASVDELEARLRGKVVMMKERKRA